MVRAAKSKWTSHHASRITIMQRWWHGIDIWKCQKSLYGTHDYATCMMTWSDAWWPQVQNSIGWIARWMWVVAR
jgi:hypothetical protein